MKQLLLKAFGKRVRVDKTPSNSLSAVYVVPNADAVEENIAQLESTASGR
jgi:hypothetical protein